MFRARAKFLKIMIVDLGLFLSAVAIGLNFAPGIRETSHYFWIPLVFMLLTVIVGWKNKKFHHHDKEVFQSNLAWVWRIIKLQMGFYLVVFGLLWMMTPDLVAHSVSPEASSAVVFSEFIRTQSWTWGFYPYAMMMIFAVIFGVIANPDEAKTSNAISVLFHKKLSQLQAAILDFFTLLGFILGIFLIASFLAFFLGQWIGSYWGITITNGFTVRTGAIAFALLYLPFTTPWKDSMEHVGKLTVLSFGTLLIILSVILSFYLIIATGVVDWFLSVIQKDPNVALLQQAFYVTNPMHDLFTLLMIIIMVSAPLLGSYIAWMSAGRSVWTTLLAFLPIPAMLFMITMFSGEGHSDWMATVNFFPLGFIALITCIVALIPWRENTLWQKSFNALLPNELGRKKRRLRTLIKHGASFILYAMAIWLLLGAYGMQKILIAAIPLVMGVLILVMVGLVGYLVKKQVRRENESYIIPKRYDSQQGA